MAEMQAKPMPVPDGISHPYWDGANQGFFAFQRCRDCAKAQFYSRSACVHCHSGDLEWQVAAGSGRVASFSVIHRAPIASFVADTPYVLALIDMDEGFRFMCNVLHCDPVTVTIGMRVRVCFEARAGSEQKIPQVEPATA
ncbi:Zn-ribbon domain-containing OB-fold protein [Piscinibacter sakaiensis]|uniref:Zn-ribbon domain-containing OB-fold protein n=1 Tax=Piscinibacter sakaiensis TaxID=1547922 RepID=UPI003AABD6F9